jgi:hypothetical protein
MGGGDIGNVGLKAAGSRFVTFPLFDLLSTSIFNLCDMVQDVRLSAHRSDLKRSRCLSFSSTWR